MADKSASLSKQIRELGARLDKLEAKLDPSDEKDYEDKDGENGTYFCAMPEVPPRIFAADVSPSRARLIQLIGKKWVNGTKLRYYFFESGPYSAGNDQKDLVREGFEVWEEVGIGIQFEEISNIGDAEIRIGFLRGDGAWSYLGRDVIDVPGQFERTMNFGWDLRQDSRGVDTPVHEIGHTLGFPHEHQNPFAGIVWDEDAVYRYFGGSPNFWDRQKTFYNVLRKLSSGEVQGSEWDPNSIMHYGFPGGLIRSPERYQGGIRPDLGLSERDIEQVRIFYPPLNSGNLYPQLQPFRLEFLGLAPAEQKNFTIQPESTGDYTIQTFGKSDTVMVLFEDVNGDLRFVDGDDDSGTSLNAQIKTRMQRGRTYVLRIRLYSNYASGDTAVMWW